MTMTQIQPTAAGRRTVADAAETVRFVLLAAIWGGSFMLVKVARQGLSPAQITLFRLALGAAVLLAVCRIRRIPVPSRAGIVGRLAVAAALGNVVPFLLLGYGERSTGAGPAGVLVGATPLLTALIAAAARAEVVTRSRAVVLLAGFTGVVVLIAPWQSRGSVTGGLACLAAAASYAAGFVYVRRYLSDPATDSFGLAAGQLVAAFALQAVTLPVFGWPTMRPSVPVLASLLVLAVVGTGLA
jgi:drug/metabolite transporter (DMT)-like permease